MFLALFITSVIVCSLVLHFNRVPFSTLMLLIVLAISAIPVLNCLVIVVGLAELGVMAYNRFKYGGF